MGREILSVTGPKPRVQFTFQNQSSAGVAEAAALRGAIETELRAGGARLGTGGAGASQVSVTLSENWRNFLLVASVQRGQTKRVVIVTLPRTSQEATGRGAAVVSLSRQIVWRQRALFISFLVTQTPPDKSSYLWILEPDRLVLYRLAQGQWQFQGSGNIDHAGPLPRDVRGLLWIEPASSKPAGTTTTASAAVRLRAALPGVDCSMPLGPAAGKLPLVCSPATAGSSDFPVFEAGAVSGTTTLVAGRNFFGPAIDRGNAPLQLQPFYSATIVEDDQSQPVFLAAALDGKTYVYDDSGKSEGSIDGWGSDIAGIKTGCGSGWQVLATRPGDWTAVDSLAAYEIVDAKAVATGEPIDFPGPVTAMSPSSGGRTADAVALDRGTGLYEAYTISLSCGH
ncbi:MAG: hypothetical protein KGL59_06155 [Acidobacteriota bacterium]|nr:hypothetical protein [Acidobacteriota bacterium]